MAASNKNNYFVPANAASSKMKLLTPRDKKSKIIVYKRL